jgi:membrane protease YdiL (CAAX protease family)
MSRLSDALGRLLPVPMPPRPGVSAVPAPRPRWRTLAAVGVVGAGLLTSSLSARPGSRRFYVSTLTLAATWTIGGLASGSLRLQCPEDRALPPRRPVVTPVATGVGAFILFYAAALIARRLRSLAPPLKRVLAFADEGREPLVLFTACATGIGEEVFFRGALYTALCGRHPVAASTAIYVLGTAATANPALVAAAAVMGVLFGAQRRATGGLQAPLLTHITWSVLMLHYLPPLFREARDEPAAPR